MTADFRRTRPANDLSKPFLHQIEKRSIYYVGFKKTYHSEKGSHSPVSHQHSALVHPAHPPLTWVWTPTGQGRIGTSYCYCCGCMEGFVDRSLSKVLEMHQH